MHEGGFAKIAKDYDKFLIAVPYHDKIQQMAGHLLVSNLVASFPGMDAYQVLEMGFGTGETTKRVLAAADEAGITIELTAVDNEPAMLEVVQEKINASNVNFLLAEAQELISLKRYKYDGIITGFMLHNLEWGKLSALVISVLEHLRPNGVFVNVDKIARDDKTVYLKDVDRQLCSLDILLSRYGEAYWAYWYEHCLDDNTHPITQSMLREFLCDGCKKIQFFERHVMSEICVAIRA